MNDYSRSLGVLNKILKNGVSDTTTATPEEVIEKYFSLPSKIITRKAGTPGRPKIEEKLKARNFTICLAPKYLDFLDRMIVKDRKVQGRGRKVRFIIDRFLEMGKRQEAQLRVICESLKNVENVLKSFSGQVKKGQKLELNSREKLELRKAVSQVQLLARIMSYSAKDLHRLLSRNEWAVMAFCIDWTRNHKEMT